MSSPQQSSRKLRFAEFELNLETAELRSNGSKSILPGQPFQVLVTLLSRPGQLVTRDELKKQLWPSDTFVDFDQSLNKAVNRLREALDDLAEHPRFIETLPRRGYRFIAEVNSADPEKQIVKSGRRKIALLAGISAATVAIVAGGLVWFSSRQSSSPPELKVWQLTTNSDENPVRNGTISPDGKYLAYADSKKMYIKLIETGEVRVVAQPEELKNEQVAWEIVSWFPGNTQLLVDAHAAGTGTDERNSGNTSIWIVSALGEPPHKVRDQANAYSVSPDGSLIAFGRNPGNLGDREIWLMRSTGEQVRRLFAADEKGPICCLGWFPNGQRVTYIRPNEAGDTLVSRSLNGGPVTTVFPSSFFKNMNDMAFLPDGRFIYALDEPAALGYTCNYWETRLDTETGKPIGKPRRLTNWAGFCIRFAGVTADSKRLAFLKWQVHRSTYVADLEARGARIRSPSHFTLTESRDYPVGWTADSKAILFVSSRSGRWGIYKQLLNQDIAEPLLTGMEEVRTPRVSADGNWFLYGVPAIPADPSSPRNLMRLPINGGPPQLVLSARPHSEILCTRSPSTLCLIGEPTEDRKQVVLSAFDPLKGRGIELARFDLDPADDRWTLALSTDGSRIAATRNPEGPIYILSLRGEPTRQINVKGRKGILSMDWAVDGKGLYVSSEAPGGAELLYVDFQGNAQTLWKNRAGNITAGLPSPDGRHLAIMGLAFDGNVWMMENF